MKRKELKIRLSFGQWLNQPAQVLGFQKTAFTSGPLEHVELPSWGTMTCRAVTRADYVRHRSPHSAVCFSSSVPLTKNSNKNSKNYQRWDGPEDSKPRVSGSNLETSAQQPASKVMAILLRTKPRTYRLMVTPVFTLNCSATFPRESKQEYSKI